MNNSAQLKQTWSEHDEIRAKQEIGVPQKTIDHLFAAMFIPGPFYYYIFNVAKLEFDFIHPNATEILGFSIEEYDFEELTGLVHPDDIIHMRNCEYMIGDFFSKLPDKNQILNYKVTYCLRINSTNGYKLMLHQAKAVSLGDHGGISKVFALQTEVDHLIKKNNYRLSFTGFNGNPSYLGIPVKEKYTLKESIGHPFTKRQLEIIKLLAVGCSNQQIADKLFISIETVRTHRKNILEKSDCQNTTELVVRCVKQGII